MEFLFEQLNSAETLYLYDEHIQNLLYSKSHSINLFNKLDVTIVGRKKYIDKYIDKFLENIRNINNRVVSRIH